MTDQAEHRSPASGLLAPFELAIPQADLDDLAQRLERVRWPDLKTVGDTSQGPPLAKLQALVARWRNGYDWRRCEALLNSFGQHRTDIDGVGIYFLHIHSPEPDALPLGPTLLWPMPGSVDDVQDRYRLATLWPGNDLIDHDVGEARQYHFIGTGDAACSTRRELGEAICGHIDPIHHAHGGIRVTLGDVA